jgi:hypothetical protein
MRKLLYVFALIVAGFVTLGVFTSEASAQIQCPGPTNDPTISHIQRERSSCESNCPTSYKDPKQIAGCKKSCGDTYDYCKKQIDKKVEDDKAKTGDGKKIDPPLPRAVLTCPKTDVSAEQISKIRTSCATKCDDAKTTASPGWISACKNACDTTYNFCMGKFTAWDQKRKECAKPTRACIDACPHGTGDDFNKCFNACANKNADLVQDCIKRAMDW